jgi:hypothetical protein
MMKPDDGRGTMRVNMHPALVRLGDERGIMIMVVGTTMNHIGDTTSMKEKRRIIRRLLLEGRRATGIIERMLRVGGLVYVLWRFLAQVL